MCPLGVQFFNFAKVQLITQKFRPGDKSIAIRSGFTLDCGWKIGEIKFPEPGCKGGFFDNVDNELFDGLAKVLQDDSQDEFRDRVFRSLEWFRLAHTEVDEISDLSKMVMMSTAFEILLQFPDHGQTKYFAEYIDKCFRLNESHIIKRTDEKGREFEAGLAAWWAWDFYDLRSRIVHGDKINPEKLRYKDWISQLIIADLVFWQCMTIELFGKRYIGDIIRELAMNFAKSSKEVSDTDFETTVVSSCFGFGFEDIHRALGWLSSRKKS